MFKGIALKDLKQLRRDKKNMIFNIIIPLLMILIIAVSTGIIYAKTNDGKTKINILSNSNYVRQKLKDNKNYNIEIINNLSSITNLVKKNKNDIGVVWNNDEKTINFVTNSDASSNIAIVQDDVLQTIKLSCVTSNLKVNIKLRSVIVKTDYEPITLKLTAAICGFLVLLLSFRLNNVNTFYLTTNEKSSGVLEVMLSAPINEVNIILGKWIANFVSCLILTLTILLPVYSLFIMLFQIFLHLDINLIIKLPIVIFEVMLLCIVISFFQLFLGFMSKSIKQAQMYLAYSPIILFVPLSIIFGFDIKNLYMYTLQNYVIDCIPILNFYDLIQISILGIINIKKIILVFTFNVAFLFLLLNKLITTFRSEKILFFKN